MSVLTVVVGGLSLVFIGSIAGVFFAYSSSVMMALDAIKPESAIDAMNSINVKIQNPAFLSAFMLAPVASAVTGGLLFKAGHRTAAILFCAAAVVYVVGTFVPTMAINVPMNDNLEAAKVPDAGTAARVWADYSERWTMWNTVRGVFATVSLVLAGAGVFAWGSSARTLTG